MVRAAWWATGQSVKKELDMTKRLNNKFRLITSSRFLSLVLLLLLSHLSRV